LHVLILELNALTDKCRHVGISIDEIHKHIASRDVLSWLRAKFPDVMRNSDDEQQNAEIVERLDSIQNAYGGDERKRWGLENSGICLLLAWILEVLAEATYANTHRDG
jgi:hypothetical protein